MSIQRTCTKPDKSSEIAGTIIGYILVPFLGGLVFMWYNHVWFQHPLSYWQLILIGLAVMVAGKCFRPIVWLMGFVAAVCVLAQVGSWIGLVALPLIKL